MVGLKRKRYEAILERLDEELVVMAHWASAAGQRIVVLFEGRDTAGKGGVINAISRHLNPRQCRTVALAKPTETERNQWYFQRYVAHLPARGEIVLFDRSWYNRAGVERVMGYCSEQEALFFLRQAPAFEQQLIDDGILLFKYWLCCDQQEQEARLRERLDDPLKRWKLSAVDLMAREKYREYTQARDEMLAATHSPTAPWTLVDFNDQRLGRLTLIRDLLDRLPETNVDPEPVTFGKLKHEPMREEYGVLSPISPYPAAPDA